MSEEVDQVWVIPGSPTTTSWLVTPRAFRSPVFGLLVVAGVFMPGCQSEQASSAPMAGGERSDGATLILSAEALWDTGDAWSVPREPVQAVGVRDGDEEYQFDDIAAAARQSDGDLVVADAGSQTVRLFAPDGIFKRMLGGAGAGPGEFQNPMQILIREADSIFVWDDVSYRLTKFDSAGNLAGIHTFSREQIAKAAAPPLYPASALLLTSGELLVRLIEKSKDVPTTGRFRQRSGALLVSADLAAIDTLMFFGDVEQVSVDSPWGPLPLVPALARHTAIAVQPDEARVCIGDQERAEVRCFDPDGSAIVVRWQAEPIPVRGDEREIDAWRARTLELYEQKLVPDDARRLVARVPAPTEHPPYSQLVLDPHGNLWVERGPVVSGGSPATEYLVFDRTGRLLGPVSVPPVRILAIGTDYMIGVHRDELEVEYLRVFEIAKPGTP